MRAREIVETDRHVVMGHLVVVVVVIVKYGS